MPLLSRLWPFGKRQFALDVDTAGGALVGSASTTGITVTQTSAMGLTAFFCGVTNIADSIAGTPPIVVEKESGLPRDGENLFQVIFEEGFNQFHTGYQSLELVVWGLLTYGWWAAEVEVVDGGIALYPLSQSRTEPKFANNRLTLEHRDSNERVVTYTPGIDAVYIVGHSRDGIFGINPVQQFRDTLGYAKGLDDYGARFFKNAATPSMIITTAGPMSLPERTQLQTDLKAAASGDNDRAVLVIPNGTSAAPMSLPPADTDYLETKISSLRDICRILNIPPSRVHDTSDSTYSNIEQESLDYVRRTVMPWMRRIQSAFNKQLLPSELRLTFDPSGLLEGTLMEQFAAWQIGINAGITSPEYAAQRMGLPTDEVRRMAREREERRREMQEQMRQREDDDDDTGNADAGADSAR